MTHRFTAKLAVALAAASVPVQLIAATPPETEAQTIEDQALERVDRLADRLLAQDRFSGIILAARNGQVIFEKGYGLADREQGLKVRPETAFHLGSANKMWTATAILQLVASGSLSLDDKVGKILTDYPNREVAERVTVRHLLTHSGGTGDIDIFSPEHEANRARVRELSDFLALHGNRGLEFEPGSKQSYSNYGFILLGLIVERLSGMSYRDYVAKHIFAPAGMTHSGFPTRESPPAWVAVGYTGLSPDLETVRPLHRNTETLPYRGMSAGGAVASARDMLRFTEGLRSGKLIPQALFAEALKPQMNGSGFGIWTGGKGEQVFWGHGGGASGMNTDTRAYPSRGLSLIVLANRDPNIAGEIAGFFEYGLRDPDGTTSLFLRGTMNGWSATAPLKKLTDGSYSAEFELSAGDHEFKIASEDWETVALGAAFGASRIEDETAAMPLGIGPNAAMHISKGGTFRFTLSGLSVGVPALSVRRLRD